MPASSIIDPAMSQGVAISFIVLGGKNAWWGDVMEKKRVNPRSECYEMFYPRSWHRLHNEAIIADERFQTTCTRLFDDMMVVARNNLLKGGGVGSFFVIIDPQADGQACTTAQLYICLSKSTLG